MIPHSRPFAMEITTCIRASRKIPKVTSEFDIFLDFDLFCLVVEPSFDGRGCIDQLSAIL